MKKTLLTLFAITFLAFSPFEKEADESVEGRKKYALGEMEAAGEQFAAAGDRLKDNAEAFYDLATAQLAMQKYEEAAGSYKKALETGKADRNLRSDIFYNMGNAMAGLGRYQDAEKFYIRSLTERPSKEAAENLEVVRRIIQQQKEQQQEQEKQKDQDKQQNQDQEQNKEDQNQENQQDQDQEKDNNEDRQQDQQDQKEEQNQEDKDKENQEEETGEGQDQEPQEQNDEDAGAAEAEQNDDESPDDDGKNSTLQQFKQRKNLQISPFILKKQPQSESSQTW